MYDALVFILYCWLPMSSNLTSAEELFNFS